MKDSDSEDEKRRFESAVDPTLDPYSKKCASNNKKNNIVCECSNNDNLFNVTAGMQAYVAKHLTKTLDKLLVPTDFPKTEYPYSQNHSEECIKLFSSSTQPCKLPSEENGRNHHKPKRKRKKDVSSSSSDEDEIMKRFSSVAVSSEWVLKKQGVYDETLFNKDEDNDKSSEKPKTKKKKKKKSNEVI